MATSLFAFTPFDPWHLLVIMALALLFFGKRLPEVGRSLGKGIAEFKKGLKDVQEEMNRDDEPPKKRLSAEDEDRPRKRISAGDEEAETRRFAAGDEAEHEQPRKPQ